MNEDQNEQRAEKFRLLYRFLRVCQRWIDEGCWSPLLAQRACQNGRNDTHIAPMLPECAHGINQIVKSREVLPPRAQ